VKLWRLENNVAAAKRNIKKAGKAARRKRTIAHLPKSARSALGKKGPRLQERNETAQDKGRFSSSSLLMQYRLQLFPAAFSPAFARARFAPLFPATSSALLPATLI